MLQLILTSLLLGAGLAMDACAVSMTNGLNEPKMKNSKSVLIAGIFAFFQMLMPMIGWLCVTLIADRFAMFAKWVPYIALVLLTIIGGKMLFDGIKHYKHSKTQTASSDGLAAETGAKPLTFAALLTQAVATSIDALSTGFTLSNIAGSVWWQALVSVGIIGAVTFGISVAGVFIGKKFGDRLGSRAEIVGGIILIFIGIEIFAGGVLF